MTRFDQGDQVVSIEDIGGWLREHVPAGTPGTVIEADWGANAVVRFHLRGGFFSSDRSVDVEVSDDEIR